MKRRPFKLIRATALASALAGYAALALAKDWPTWGGGPSRNMVLSDANTLPIEANVEAVGEDGKVDPAKAKNVKWAARLGSQTYGNPTVAGGRVYVGTNNDPPRDPKHAGDRGVLACFDEKDGHFFWQLAVPKLTSGKHEDWEFTGLCTSPAVDGDRVYAVTNRCEIVCLDAAGLS